MNNINQTEQDLNRLLHCFTSVIEVNFTMLPKLKNSSYCFISLVSLVSLAIARDLGVYSIIALYWFIFKFSEESLQQSRCSRIQDALELLYTDTTTKFSKVDAKVSQRDSILVTTADQDRQKDSKKSPNDDENGQKSIDSAINVIVHVKKIKRDLHIQ